MMASYYSLSHATGVRVLQYTPQKAPAPVLSLLYKAGLQWNVSFSKASRSLLRLPRHGAFVVMGKSEQRMVKNVWALEADCRKQFLGSPDCTVKSSQVTARTKRFSKASIAWLGQKGSQRSPVPTLCDTSHWTWLAQGPNQP